MCHFITAVLPKTAPHSELAALARRHGRQFRPLANPGIERQLRRDQRYFLTTLRHCDCGTVLGSYRRRHRHVPDWAAEEQRLRKKGWAAAKIARAMVQKRRSSAAVDQRESEANLAELASWRSLIAEVFGSGVREFGLLLHSYHGPLDETIQLEGVERVIPDKTVGERLLWMWEDVLYCFHQSAGSAPSTVGGFPSSLSSGFKEP
ncbi:MAG TPA: hypothetical protein VNQ90_00330 [Chthoniobacteraceae bacterium]|nr:hypothetical protein [Chthoniobacteraceae bacterium]